MTSTSTAVTSAWDGTATSSMPSRTGPGLPLLHERDESPDPTAAAPDPVIAQANHDIDAGMVDTDVHAAPGLDAKLAAGLGIAVPAAMPKVLAHPAKPEVNISAALSLMALPGDGGIRSRSVAILVADGVDGKSIAVAQAALHAVGATVHLIAPRVGRVKPANGDPFDATGTLENSAPVRFDGLVLPDGVVGLKTLGGYVEVMDFISNQFRHGKTLLAIGASNSLLEQAGVSAALASGEADPGILTGAAAKAEHAAAAFIAALGRHRHPEREAGALAL